MIKQVHSIGGHVHVIMVEDETKIKSKFGWDSKCDNLIGFCGVKIHHRCVTDFIPIIRTREVG